jgi:hypothetical protein
MSGFNYAKYLHHYADKLIMSQDRDNLHDAAAYIEDLANAEKQRKGIAGINPSIMATRYRVNWRGKLILQVRIAYVDRDAHSSWDCLIWRDAKVTDLPPSLRAE